MTASATEPTAEAAELLMVAWGMGHGRFVRPFAVPGFVFAVLSHNGFPFAIRLRARRPVQ